MNKTLLHLLLGSLMLLIGAGSPALAQTGSTDPAKKDKDDPLVEEAKKLILENKLDAAIKKYDEAVKANRELSPTLLWLSRLFYSLNSQKGNQLGREYLERALAAHPNHPEVYLTNASIALGEGRLTEAFLNCDMALRYADDRINLTLKQRNDFQKNAHAGLATVFEKRGDWGNALDHLDKWFEKENTGELKQRVAHAFFMLGKEKEALEALKEAGNFDKDKKLAPAEVVMAQFWAQKAESDSKKKKECEEKAENFFKDALKNHPKDAKCSQAYGTWLLVNGRLAEAEKQAETAKGLDPTARETLGLLGQVARFKGDYPAAEKIFEDMYRAKADDFFATNQLALVLIEQDNDNKKKRAVALAEINEKALKNQAEPLATLGWCYFKMGRLDNAETALNAATSPGQMSPDTAYYLAELKVKRSNFDEAYRLLKKAVENKGVFVNRAAAKTLLADVDKGNKVTPKVKEEVKKEEDDAKKALEAAGDKEDPMKNTNPSTPPAPPAPEKK